MTHIAVHSFRLVVATGAVIVLTSACSAVTVAPKDTFPDPTLSPCSGVTVVVDERTTAGTGNGGTAEPQSACVDADTTITAEAALGESDIASVIGTSDAGAAVVCRVNSTPNSNFAITKPRDGIYFENCASTPPDYAHWVVWHKSSATGSWDNDGQDITTLNLAPGSVVALVFTYLDKPATPSF